MSWKAVGWAKTWNGDLTSPEAFVLFIIAEHFNEKALRSWPAVSTIQRETRLGRATVFRALDTLEQSGLIQIEHWRTASGKQRANRYCLPFYDDRSVARPTTVVVEDQAPPEGLWPLDGLTA